MLFQMPRHLRWFLRKNVLVCETGKKYTKAHVMKRQSRYLRTMDNTKIWKGPLSILPNNPATYAFSRIMLPKFLYSFSNISECMRHICKTVLDLQGPVCQTKETFHSVQCNLLASNMSVCLTQQLDKATNVLFSVTASSSRGHNMMCASKL